LRLLLESLAERFPTSPAATDWLQGIECSRSLAFSRSTCFGKAASSTSNCLAVLFVFFLLARRIAHSSFGLSLRAIPQPSAARRRDRKARSKPRLIAISTPLPRSMLHRRRAVHPEPRAWPRSYVFSSFEGLPTMMPGAGDRGNVRYLYYCC